MDMQKIDQLGQAFAEFKTANDARLKSIETKGYAPADLEEKTNKINDKIEALETELKKTQTAMNRSTQNGQGQETDEKKEAYKKAFNSYMRKGQEMEIKAHSVGVDADGGYLVNEEISSEVVKKVFESSPMRQLASVQTIGSDRLEIICDLEEVGSGWVAETAARPETSTAQFNQLMINVHELYAFPKATQKFLDDASINVEAWLAGKVSEKFARDEATAFISGDGSGKPKGILAYAAGTGFNQIEQIVSGHATELTGDGLINLFYGLKDAYMSNAVWMMKREAVKMVRKFKDLNGQYLWQPGLQAGQPATLLGKPIMEAADMPAVGAAALPVAFGDFKQGYQIVDRIGIRTLRDPFTAKPYVGFYTTKRVGGAVKNFEAIKLQVISA